MCLASSVLVEMRNSQYVVINVHHINKSSKQTDNNIILRFNDFLFVKMIF